MKKISFFVDCLNPYSNGMKIELFVVIIALVASVVLILILME